MVFPRQWWVIDLTTDPQFAGYLSALKSPGRAYEGSLKVIYHKCYKNAYALAHEMRFVCFSLF